MDGKYPHDKILKIISLNEKFKLKSQRDSITGQLKCCEKWETVSTAGEGTKDTGIIMYDWWGYKLVYHCGKKFLQSKHTTNVIPNNPTPRQMKAYIHTNLSENCL